MLLHESFFSYLLWFSFIVHNIVTTNFEKMGLRMKILVTIALFLVLVAFLPNTKILFGFDVKVPKRNPIELPESFSGPLLSNQLLNQADKLFERELIAPESLAKFKDDIYGTLADGRIVQILPDTYRTVTRFDPLGLGPECGALRNFGKCGRPLGAQFDSSGLLYVAVSSFGLYSVNVTSGEQKLVASNEKLSESKLLNDLAIIEKPNGHKIFYLTDSTQKWSFAEVGMIFAENDTSGRLLRFDTETGETRIELDNLGFPNGLLITEDRKYILFASTSTRRIYKYGISGSEKGKFEILLDKLPGEPDQIRKSQDKTRETYWLGIFSGRTKNRPNFALDTMPSKASPLLLRFIIRLQRAIGFAIQKFGTFFGSQSIEELGIDIKLGISATFGACTYGIALEFTPDGEIVNSMHSPDGSICAISEIREIEPRDPVNREFYLGSPVNAYVGKLVVPKTAFRNTINPSNIKKVPKTKLNKSDSKQNTNTPKPLEKIHKTEL